MLSALMGDNHYKNQHVFQGQPGLDRQIRQLAGGGGCGRVQTPREAMKNQPGLLFFSSPRLLSYLPSLHIFTQKRKKEHF